MACRRREGVTLDRVWLSAFQLLGTVLSILLARRLKEEGAAKERRGQRWRV